MNRSANLFTKKYAAKAGSLSSKFAVFPVLASTFITFLIVAAIVGVIADIHTAPRHLIKPVATSISLLISCLKIPNANRIAATLNHETRGDFGVRAMVPVGVAVIAAGVQLAVTPPIRADKVAARLLLTVISTVADAFVFRPVWMAVAALQRAVELETALGYQIRSERSNTIDGRWATNVRPSLYVPITSADRTSKAAADIRRRCSNVIASTGWVAPVACALSLWVRLVISSVSLSTRSTQIVVPYVFWTAADLARLAQLGWVYWLVQRLEQDLRRAAVVAGDDWLCVQISLSPCVDDYLPVGNGLVISIVSGVVTALTVLLPLPIASQI